jgi:HEAT repeat protein/cyclophilin family peptidyl-prolyl cis-trans isomerase
MRAWFQSIALAAASAAALVTVSARAPQPATISVQDIALAADRIRHDRWYDAVTTPGANSSIRQNSNADMDLLLLALKQPFPELRAAAVREFGRFELAQNATFIASFLSDPVNSVKREAADALVQTLWDKSAAEAAPAVELLDMMLLQDRSLETQRAFWMAIAELPLDVKTGQKYEERFINEIRQATDSRFAALEALLVLTQHRRGRPMLATSEAEVMKHARMGLDTGNFDVMVGTTNYGKTIRYLEILQAAQADADDIAFDAARFFCRRVPPHDASASGGCGFDIRLLGVELLNPSNPRHVPVLLDAARNRADIRAAVTAIRQLIKSPAVTRCQLLDIAQQTEAEADVIAALGEETDERKGECGDWSPILHLTTQAGSLMSATRGTDWVAPMAALEALAKMAPAAARPIANDIAANHAQWQVRQAAARVAGKLKDRALAEKLFGDSNLNVRNAALEALVLSEHPKLIEFALAALSNSDFQLVRTAALALKSARDPKVLNELFNALRRLSGGGNDNSRRARLAVLERIEELLPLDTPDNAPSRSMALQELLRDFDPAVAKATGELLQKVSTDAVEIKPTHRRAMQPLPATLQILPPCAIMYLDQDDPLIIILNRKRAPVAVSRFLQGTITGYFGSTFYRSDKNLTVFGPGMSNDESGSMNWTRFARDEPGTPVRFLSVTMLNFGPDTADGRFAIRWHGDPELDRRETVIGQAVIPAGAPTMRSIGLGKPIKKLAVGGEGRLGPAGPGDPCYPLKPW